MKAWYTVHTKPRQEHTAEEHLHRQGFPVYLPRIQVTCRRQGRWRNFIEPLFPRYLFIQADPEIENLAPVRSTRGVSGLVRFGTQLIPVPDIFLATIRAKADPDTGVLIPDSPQFRTGDRVTILSGPFAQLEGIFQCEQGESRAQVLLECLGSLSTITLSRHNLSRVS